MRLERYRELAQPTYGENGVCVLKHFDRAAGKACFSLHWHERIELIRVTEGSMELLLDETTVVPLSAGELGIVGPRQPHQALTGPDGVCYDVVMFEAACFLNATPAVQGFVKALADARLAFAPKCIQTDVITAVDSIIHTDPSIPLAGVGDVYRLLALIQQHCHPVVREPHPADERFSAVIEHVNAHYLEPLSAAGLSDLFGYEESYFCRRFKKATGITLLKYIEILRLEEAQRLLVQSSDPVSSIALQCGFADVCYFSHRFHRHFGLSPSAFRRGA